MPESEKYKIWWDEENQIIRYKQFEDQNFTPELAQENSEKIDRILNEKHINRYLLDLVNLTTIPDRNARKAIIGLANKYSFLKIAILSRHTAMRVLINFVVTSAGHRKIKAFTDEAEAIKWLREEK